MVMVRLEHAAATNQRLADLSRAVADVLEELMGMKAADAAARKAHAQAISSATTPQGNGSGGSFPFQA